MDLNQILDNPNIAEDLSEDDLNRIGSDVVRNFDLDIGSRHEWWETNKEWLKLATQIKEDKNTPWEGAANVKYPLLTTAAVQFHARAYPAIIPGTQLVRGRSIGKDETGDKMNRAERISKHMSWQLLEQMEDWEEDTDKLLIMLPIVGCMFRKVFFDPMKGHNSSELVTPGELVVNYFARSLETASRKTHVLFLDPNAVHSRIMAGLYLDHDLAEAAPNELLHSLDEVKDERQGLTRPANDESATRAVLEQHCFLDLDEDGYHEPYIVTVDYMTGKVLRIVARFEREDIVTSLDGNIVMIRPIEHFVKYSFIPSPDGGFYDIGFGTLLGPLNEVANTLTNQLLDAGTLSNMQAGFLGRGIRLKKGEAAFTPGEWKQVNNTGDDLRKNIFPLPVREPSGVLFNMLNMMINSGERLSSITDMMVGETPGQNTPATTSMATLEQGLKVFTAIYKRIHRSLKKELRKLFDLNSRYLNPEEYFTVLDEGSERGETIGVADYNTQDADVVPYSDPSVVTRMEKLAKVQGLMEIFQLGQMSPAEVTRRYLEATEQPNIEALMQPPQPQVDPKIELETAKFQHQQQIDVAQLELDRQRIEAEAAKDAADAQSKLMKAQIDAALAGMKLDLDKQNMQLEKLMALMQMQQQDRQHDKEMKANESKRVEASAGDKKAPQ